MKPLKLRLFWKLGLTHVLLLVVVLLAVDTYAVQTLRHDYFRAAFSQLESMFLLIGDPFPHLDNRLETQKWAEWIARSGMRATVIAHDGTALADSSEEPDRMENHASRPEVQSALATGEGRAVRHSSTWKRDLVYLALRRDSRSGPVVIRLAVPVQRLDEAVRGFRRRLWTASAVILLLAGGFSLLFFRSLSARIQRLQEFSRRVADGDFAALPADHRNDELAELSRTLGETASRLDQTIRILTEERNQSAAILRSMVEGVAVIGPDQRVVFCNAAFRRALSIERTPWEGRPSVEVIRYPDLVEDIQKALLGSETIHSEIVAGTVRTRNFAATAAPVRSDRQTAGAVLVLHDISELRRLERARRDFVANVSHELKTPLTAIQGFAETLLSGVIEDTQNRRRFLEIIRDHAARLARLTEGLLKLAQIEAGKLELESRPVRVGEFIEPCLETTRLKLAEKQLELVAHYKEDLPAVRGDVHALQEIFQNLLDNAALYTPAGGRITVHATSKNSQVIISVSDTGVGIPKVDQERVFERFYRVDAARSREMGGTGLGLAIVKHLVEAHGGSIELDSEVGHGSTFAVHLPAA